MRWGVGVGVGTARLQAMPCKRCRGLTLGLTLHAAAHVLHWLASKDTTTTLPSAGNPRPVTTPLSMVPRAQHLKLVSTRMMSVRLYSPVCFSCHTRSEDSRLKRPAVCTGVLPSMGPRSGPRPGRAPRERRDDSGAESGPAWGRVHVTPRNCVRRQGGVREALVPVREE